MLYIFCFILPRVRIYCFFHSLSGFIRFSRVLRNSGHRGGRDPSGYTDDGFPKSTWVGCGTWPLPICFASVFKMRLHRGYRGKTRKKLTSPLGSKRRAARAEGKLIVRSVQGNCTKCACTSYNYFFTPYNYRICDTLLLFSSIRVPGSNCTKCQNTWYN